MLHKESNRIYYGEKPPGSKDEKERRFPCELCKREVHHVRIYKPLDKLICYPCFDKQIIDASKLSGEEYKMALRKHYGLRT